MVALWRYASEWLPSRGGARRDRANHVVARPQSASNFERSPARGSSRRDGLLRDLIVSQELLRELASGRLTDRQTSAIVSHALGQQQVNDSVLVNAVDAYCLPWRVAQILTGGPAASQVRPNQL